MKKLVSRIYLLLILAFLYVPIFVLIVFSFNESRSRGVWTGFSFTWYVKLFQNETVISAMTTTVLVSLLAAGISTVLGTITAIGLYNSKSAYRRIMISLTYLPMLNSDIVTGISLMMLFSILGLQLGFETLLLSHITFCIPYVIISVMPRLFQIDRHVYEAALDLGADPIQAYWRVIVPDIFPSIVTGFLLSMTLSIDDFMISFFNTGQGIQNIAIYVYTSTKRGINPEINALSTIMFLVIMVMIFLLNYKNMVKMNKTRRSGMPKEEF